MAYIKSALIGIATGVATTVAWVGLQLFMLHQQTASSSSGGLGAASGNLLYPLLGGFALGFLLMLRRERRRGI